MNKESFVICDFTMQDVRDAGYSVTDAETMCELASLMLKRYLERGDFWSDLRESCVELEVPEL